MNAEASRSGLRTVPVRVHGLEDALEGVARGALVDVLAETEQLCDLRDFLIAFP